MTLGTTMGATICGEKGENSRVDLLPILLPLLYVGVVQTLSKILFQGSNGNLCLYFLKNGKEGVLKTIFFPLGCP